MDDEKKKDMDAGTVTPDDSTPDDKKEEKTYTRDELNKIINAEKTKVEKELKDKMTKEKNEAERLAKLSVEEKAAEKEKILAEKEQELNHKELVNSAKDILSDKGLSSTFAEFIVSKTDTVESVNTKIENFTKHYNEDLQKMVEKRLAGEPPKTGAESTKKNIERASY